MARTPGYRLHKPSGLAFIEIYGKRHYLGKHGTAASRAKFNKMLLEYLASGSALDSNEPKAVTCNVLIDAFMDFAEVRYRKNGQQTTEVRSFNKALSIVHQLYGDEPANEFGPIKFMACRQRLIEEGHCRRWINSYCGRIRRAWKWGVSREMVPETVWRALQSVEGLRKGEAPDLPPVKPVSAKHVAAIEPFASPVLWGLIQFQLLTGCRPGEACAVTMRQITMAKGVWEYRPGSHKTEHHGKSRVIHIGPKAQKVLKPFLRDDLDLPLFSPVASKEWHLARRRKRNAPNRRVKHPKKKPGIMFTVGAYGHSIAAACAKAKISPWHPNQLRHSTGTLIRSEFDLESARVVLGHSQVATSEIYAEVDQSRAKKIARKLG